MSTFIKMLLVMVSNAIAEISIFDTVLTKHKSPLKLYAWVIGRMIIQSYIYSFNPSLRTSQDLTVIRLSWILNIIYMMTLIYLWLDLYLNPSEQISKIFLMVVTIETLTALCGTILIALLNFLEGKTQISIVNFVAPVEPLDFLYPLLIGGIAFTIIKNKTIIAFLSHYKVRHTNIITALGMAYFFGSIITDIRPLQQGMVMQHIALSITLLIALYALIHFYHEITLQRRQLSTTQAIVSNHYDTMLSRINDLESQRQEINQKMASLVSQSFPEDLTRQYLADMEAMKSHLYQFMFTSYYMIDALLSDKANLYQQQGTSFMVQCTGLHLKSVNEFEVCRLLMALFHYIDTLEPEIINMKLSSYLNQIIITVELSAKPSMRTLKRFLSKNTIDNVDITINGQTIYLSLNDQTL